MHTNPNDLLLARHWETKWKHILWYAICIITGPLVWWWLWGVWLWFPYSQFFLFEYVIFRNPLHMVFLLHSWYVIGFVRNMKICFSEDLLWFKRYWSRDILKQGLFFMKFYGRHTDLVHRFDTYVCTHVEEVVHCSPTVPSDWFPKWIVTGATCGSGYAHSHLISLLMGSSWFHQFIIYTRTLHNLSVLGLYVYINNSDLSDCFISDLCYLGICIIIISQPLS